jgi:signal transduction histidine kinase
VISAASDGRSLIVSVDDDGPGVPPHERERVFDRFHRSEASRDRATGGSGLGLGISRSIVELHGGRIWLEDSPLGGARASFSLGGFRAS